MDIKRVGIVGSGTMGSGIAEVAAKNGLEVVLRSRSQSGADGMVQGLQKSLNKQVEKGKLVRGRPRRHPRPGPGSHRAQGTRRLRHRGRVGPRGPGREEGALRRARQDLRPPRHPGHEHVHAAGGGDGCGHRAARAGVRHPLLQPGADDGPRRGHPGHHLERRDRSRPPSPSPPPAARARSRCATSPASWSTRSCSPT